MNFSVISSCSRSFARFIFSLGLFISFSSQATFLDLGNVTQDTRTGLEWLDVAETYRQLLAEVDSRLSSDLQGWRYPTLNEMEGLLDSAGGIGPYTGPTTRNNGVA